MSRPASLALLCLIGVAGCAGPTSPTMETVPPEWRDRNSWGPEGNAARTAGELRPSSCPPELAAWRELGQQYLQDGDLLFRFTVSYPLRERLASALIANGNDSPFSHNAIAHWENGILYVYDTVPLPEGVRKMPFEFWALDNAPHSFAVKRLKPEYQHHIPAAIAYIEDAYCRQVPFDAALRPDDERLYCTEMIEKGFRTTGLELSEPLPIRCLPHYLRFAWLGPPARRYNGIEVDQPIFAIGNCHYGMFGSPKLDLVYSDLRERREERRRPPRCETARAD